MWVTTDAVTVLWETPEPVVGWVEYGPTPELGQRQEEPEARRIHELRLELRSTKIGVETMIIEKVTRKHWTPILIDAATYKTFGQPESWRVSLWQGKKQVGAQQSFLW